MVEDFYRQLSRWIQSDFFEYSLAALFVLIWWAASRMVGLFRGKPAAEERPRRRLPL